MTECEYCAQLPGGQRVVERPMASEVTELSRFYWVVNPERLVFCDAECRTKWHRLRRMSVWMRHGSECACSECL